MRLEQLYPFPHKAFATELKKYPHATEVVWCQDEPQNQGAWFQIQHNLLENLEDDQKLSYAGRPASRVARGRLLREAQRAAEGADRVGFGRARGLVLGK